ncbi:DUF6126 family protein [Streptomyces sp. NPDC002889]
MPKKSAISKKYEDRFPRGLVIRLFVYLIAGHLFAGFLYLLFMVGGDH